MQWRPGLTVIKDPTDEVNYLFEYAGLIDGDTIDTAVIISTGVSVLPGDITISGNTVLFLVAGGTVGVPANINITITTVSTIEIFQRTVKFKLIEL